MDDMEEEQKESANKGIYWQAITLAFDVALGASPSL
jgi:hypothetical protein